MRKKTALLVGVLVVVLLVLGVGSAITKASKEAAASAAASAAAAAAQKAEQIVAAPYKGTCPVISAAAAVSAFSQGDKFYIMGGFGQAAGVKIVDSRILFVFYDAYGAAIGTYDWDVSATAYPYTGAVQGGGNTKKCNAYVYAVADSSGLIWGNNKASVDEAIKYGKCFPITVKSY